MINPVPATQDPKWRRLPEERPTQILHAALAVFGEEGISAAKLEDIASRAGVSKGTIYLYFESKEELFREVVRQILVPNVAEAERLLSADGPAPTQIERYLRNTWVHFDRSDAPGWIRLVLGELHRYPDLLEFYYDTVVKKSNDVLGALLQRGMDRGEFRVMDPVEGVRMVKALLLMHVLWVDMPSFRLCSKPGDRDRVIDAVISFVLNALRPDAPAQGAPPDSR